MLSPQPRWSPGPTRRIAGAVPHPSSELWTTPQSKDYLKGISRENYGFSLVPSLQPGAESM